MLPGPSPSPSAKLWGDPPLTEGTRHTSVSPGPRQKRGGAWGQGWGWGRRWTAPQGLWSWSPEFPARVAGLDTVHPAAADLEPGSTSQP